LRARIAFLSRLVALKLTALFAFVLLSLYTPSTTNALLDRAGDASKLLAAGTESSLESLGSLLGDTAMLMPKKGAVELTMRYVGMDKVLLFIGITIALYLAWLAYDALRNGSALSLDRKGKAEALRSVYLKGLLVNLLNPKVIVFFVTFLPQFVTAADPDAAKKLLFLGFVFVLVNVPVCVGLILFADRIAVFLKRSPKATRIVDWLFAGVLGAFAVRLVLAESR